MVKTNPTNNENNNFNNIRINASRAQQKTEKQQAIFDIVDQNSDGIISESEYQSYIVTGKTRGANGQYVENQYIKLKALENGRSLVVDQNGKQWIMSHDGIILKGTYVATQIAKENLQKAQTSFKKQLSKDGWAGKVADGISVLWNSKNRASVVNEDLAKHLQMLQELTSQAAVGSKEFNEKFKEIFGVDYNEQAITQYLSNPSEENYIKAFGDKNNIQNRVQEYNISQEVGASVVKTSAAIAGTVAIGVATGGTGLIATAAIASGTGILVNTSDRLSSDDGLTKEDAIDILKEAAIDGVTVGASGKVAKLTKTFIKGADTTAKFARGTINAAGDVAIGAGAEYVETGEVSATGILTNAAFGGVGIAAETGALQKVSKALKPKSKAAKPAEQITNLTDLDGNDITGGWFTRSSEKPVTLSSDKGWQNFKTTDGEITLLVSGNKVYYGKVGDSYTRPLTMTPGSSRLLGQASNGKAIILECNERGEYIVKHIKNDSSAAAPAAANQTKTKNVSAGQTVSTQISDKNLKRIVKDNMSEASHLGQVSVSNKLTGSMNRTSLVTVLEDNFDLTRISERIAPGEVCTIGTGRNQKLYVNNNGAAQEIKLSKEKFEELFPPQGFGLTKQKGLNNCWLVSRLNSMTESASGRAQLYSMLEETPNGDIIVKLQNSNPITFPGGRPANAPNTNLGEGASPGLEIIEQAVLVRYLQEPSERVSDISKLSVKHLNDEANRLSHSDIQATTALLGKTPKSISSKEEIKNALEQFKNGEDMGVLTWEAHARSIVNYDKASGLITYHDPYYAGVDVTCSLDELLSKNVHLSLCKAPKSTASSLTAQNAATVQAPINAASSYPQATAPRQSTIRRTAAASTSNSELEIPAGYREYTPEFGKRRIIGPNNELMIESNGRWISQIRI